MQIEILDTNTQYAGDINPKTAWDLLSDDEQAILVDVRTKAELNFVGFPDLSSINKSALNVEQQFFPGGTINDDFVEILESHLNEINLNKDTPILFLCRSGARSAKAAKIMTSNAGIGVLILLMDLRGTQMKTIIVQIQTVGNLKGYHGFSCEQY